MPAFGSRWTLKLKQVEQVLNGSKSWIYRDGAPYAALRLPDGLTWNPSGASSGIWRHEKGEYLYFDGTTSTSPEKFMGVDNYDYSIGVVDENYWTVSGDISALTGNPGSNLHVTIDYVRVGEDLVPKKEPAVWNWADNNRSSNMDFVSAVAIVAGGYAFGTYAAPAMGLTGAVEGGGILSKAALDGTTAFGANSVSGAFAIEGAGAGLGAGAGSGASSLPISTSGLSSLGSLGTKLVGGAAALLGSGAASTPAGAGFSTGNPFSTNQQNAGQGVSPILLIAGLLALMGLS